MKMCYMLIGLPASGKSTLRKKLLLEMPNVQVVSTDDFIEAYALEKGKKYEEVYREFGEEADSKMRLKLRQLIKEGSSFIWDQTNVYKSARKKKISMLKQSGYEVIAVALDLSSEELNRRLINRVSEGGKKVSFKIIAEMKANYELPSYEEGFKEVYLIGDNGVYQLLEPHVTPKLNK